MAEWLVYGRISIQLFRSFLPFLLKTAEWQFGKTFQNKKYIYIFECEWPNGNSDDLCIAELPFGHSQSNSNTNGNWGIQNAHLSWRKRSTEECCDRCHYWQRLRHFIGKTRKKEWVHFIVYYLQIYREYALGSYRFGGGGASAGSRSICIEWRNIHIRPIIVSLW